jgi:hypothetical protein
LDFGSNILGGAMGILKRIKEYIAIRKEYRDALRTAQDLEQDMRAGIVHEEYYIEQVALDLMNARSEMQNATGRIMGRIMGGIKVPPPLFPKRAEKRREYK